MIVESCGLPTDFGPFRLTLHRRLWGKRYVALAYGDISMGIVLVRLQSTCLFGTAFHSRECNCKKQLDTSMRSIVKHGRGVVVYALDEEGKGNGLAKKMFHMRFPDGQYLGEVLRDKRRYGGAVRVLKELSVSKQVRALTHEEHKRAALKKAGFALC